MIRHEHHTILGDIPGDWKARPLRALLLDHLSGDWGDDVGDVTLSVLRSTNFTDSGNLNLADVARRGFNATKAGQIQVQPDDILVERSGGGPSQPVGRVVMIREAMRDTGFANFVQLMRPNSSDMLPELLFWILHQLNKSGIVERLQHQTTQMRNLDLRDYLKVLLPVPSDPNEQARIALGETWSVAYRESDRPGITLWAEAGIVALSGRTLSLEPVTRKLKGWLRVRVREELFPLAEHLARKHRLALGGLLVKSQRTRWASCSAKRNLSLNTKLLFLSPDLVRYALVHELCHTVHMNHSGEFWRLVASHEPRYKTLDEALREAWKSVPQWMF